jgi:hypothetical protein
MKIIPFAVRLLASTLIIQSISYLLGIYKVNFVVGAGAIQFSLINAFVPLIGAFAGVGTSIFYLFAKMAIKYSVTGVFSLGMLAFCGFASFCASLYWTYPTMVTRCLLPLACMALFVLHPVGAVAWVYSCYWLIPIALYCIPKKSLFFDCLATTFIQHAVGSVLWIYACAMTPEAWISLMPFVVCERLLLAISMMIIYVVGRELQGAAERYAMRVRQLLTA